MKQSILFRGYQESDYDVLKKMIFALAEEDFDPQATAAAMTESKIQSTVLRSITHPGQLRIKMFESNNSIVGYALLTFYWSNEYHGVVALLDELYVMPQSRNQGIATQFLDYLAQNKEYALLQLEVLKKNTKALKLYQKANFEIVDRHFMIKTL